MLEAFKHAHLDPSIAAATKEVLGDYGFTFRLPFLGLWKALQEGAQAILDQTGATLLEPLYVEHGLANRMSSEALAQFYTIHESAAPKGAKLSQRHVFPELFAAIEGSLNFDDFGGMPEGVSLVVVLLLAHLLFDEYKERVTKAAAKCGWSVSVAPPKGFARAFVKLFSDYLKLGIARSAYVMDPLRCLFVGPGVLSMYAALAAISEEFGGVLGVKNPFSLSLEDRASRAHLLLLNTAAVAESMMTVDELLKQPRAPEIIAGLRVTPDG